VKIKIGFSKPKKWFVPFSWAIRALYNTKYSHTYVRWYSSGVKVDVAYEASGTSVHFTCKEVFNKKTQIIHEYELDITREQYMSLLHWCMTNAGVSYGTKQAVGIGIMKMFDLSHNPLGDKNKQICSEVVAHILNEIKDLGIGVDFEKASPKDIKTFLDSIPEIAKKIL
jgi:hypothetical protein